MTLTNHLILLNSFRNFKTPQDFFVVYEVCFREETIQTTGFSPATPARVAKFPSSPSRAGWLARTVLPRSDYMIRHFQATKSTPKEVE